MKVTVSFPFPIADIDVAVLAEAPLHTLLIDQLRKQENPVLQLIEDQKIGWDFGEIPDTLVLTDPSDEQMVALKLAATHEVFYEREAPAPVPVPAQQK